MKTFLLLAAPLLSAFVHAQEPGTYFNGTAGNDTVEGGAPGPDANGKYTISAPGIRAHYIPYGASISNLFINDTRGIERDIVMGFDNASYYTIDRQHPHLGGVPGRYANRIKNSTFSIDGTEFHVLPNENPANLSGADTLHGGPDGWDFRNWTVVAHTESSITFSITDPDGMEGFPGEVVSFVTYSVSNMTLDYKMVAMATTKKTPIMLSSHVSFPYLTLTWKNETDGAFVRLTGTWMDFKILIHPWFSTTRSHYPSLANVLEWMPFSYQMELSYLISRAP